MEGEKLLSEKRIRELSEGKPAKLSKPDERTQHGRDYDRAIFSTPVRRMQDKTQVFPLDPNDSVRTRLTHSLEVSNIARNMARGIGNWLLEEKKISRKQRDSIEIIAAACGLIHDLGNPPFGHAGEKAIQEWFRNQDKDFFEFGCEPKKAEQLKNDFLEFEGNAQTIRLIFMGLISHVRRCLPLVNILLLQMKSPKNPMKSPSLDISPQSRSLWRRFKKKLERENEEIQLCIL